MKHKLLLLATLLVAATSLFAQSADNEDEVIKIDRWNQQAFREGEILVKFKANGAVQMRAPQKAKFQTAKVNAVDALFAELGVDSVEQLMPRTGHKNVGRRVKAYNGSEIEVKDLSKLYRLTLKAEKTKNIHEAIDRLKMLDEVEFAEPNYIVYAMSLPYDDSIPTMDSATYVNEPLYSQQWGIPAINLPQLWNKPKRSSKRPVIAILDTGVDIEHPDLAANIWTNTAEANGISGQDDDANGFKDDIHGWSFIDNHSVTGDFNGHGTHCAGIAAAVGNNGIGITGANPDALIMPVTVMQSNGTGDIATIVKGIDYASANGADVISMSIGGYQYSIAEEQALGHAYANAVIVAAAGNSHMSISNIYPCPQHGSARCFPAAFTFVLGVEASQDIIGNLAAFSNYDPDGPIYSEFNEEQLYNYELRAPGTNILSTFPGGRYKILHGTSMACPLAAGAISRLLQCKEYLSKELLFGDLIHMRAYNEQGNINMLSTYNITDSNRHPELSIVSINLADTANGDGDFHADAGETIEFYPIIRNAWGQAENIRFWGKTGYYSGNDWVGDDTTLITHLQDTAYFGKPLSSYAKATSLNSWRTTISPDCADGRNINLTFFMTCNNSEYIYYQSFVMKVENGVEIGGMITEDLTLYPNVHYIVTKPLAVPKGVTLTIMPGTILKFKDGTGISVASTTGTKTITIDHANYTLSCQDETQSGLIIAKGKPDSMIVFTKADGESGDFSFNFGMVRPKLNYWYLDTMPQYDSIFFKYTCPLEYVKIENINRPTKTQNIYNAILMNSIITNCNGFVQGNGNSVIIKTNLTNISNAWPRLDVDYEHTSYISSNLANNIARQPMSDSYFHTHGVSETRDCNIFAENLIGSNPYVLFSKYTSPTIIKSRPNYYGSSVENKVRKYVYDIENGYSFGKFDLSNMLTRPSAEAHGIVWKVLVDGIDAQDEFELMPPIGVGQHRCDVYFNRAMDTTVTPKVFFGVRQPYTQHQVTENGSWSADSTIYTAYFTINDKTVSDGLNRFKIYGAEDNEHFEIPEENYRFHMEIAAAGSMSTGLMAEAGLGKVTLTWETDEEDFEDLLGYNIYRWTHDTIKSNNTWRFDTICINSSLIDSQDTAYIDYDVVPGKAYYYVIRQMTTSLDNYDLSNPITATPLTAIKGDANGSMSVDVADVITEVNYITHQNPQPFIFEAADVNSDDVVNVIDVVATVNLILHPQAQSQAINEQPATYYIENGILYVETDVVLGGVQCTFNAEQGHTFTVLNALQGFETVSNWQTENDYLFMAYSMSGKTLEIGKHALMQIGDADLTNIVLSDAQGHNIPAAPRISQDLEGNLFLPCSTKYIENGHMYIKIGDHVFDVMGQQIK